MHLETNEVQQSPRDCHPKTRVRAEISRTPFLRWSTPLQNPCTTRFEAQYESELASGATVSVRSLTDADGTTAVSYKYTPYGEMTTTDGTDNDAKANHNTFTARDYETSFMMFYRSRFYGNRMGRFFSKDSYQGRQFNPLSQNKYLYVSGNPIHHKDPFGYDGSECVGGAALNWCITDHTGPRCHATCRQKGSGCWATLCSCDGGMCQYKCADGLPFQESECEDDYSENIEVTPNDDNNDDNQDPYCGDGNCDHGNESFLNCPQDCPSSEPFCGDGNCDHGTEDNRSCPLDCRGLVDKITAPIIDIVLPIIGDILHDDDIDELPDGVEWNCQVASWDKPMNPTCSLVSTFVDNCFTTGRCTQNFICIGYLSERFYFTSAEGLCTIGTFENEE